MLLSIQHIKGINQSAVASINATAFSRYILYKIHKEVML